MKNQLSRVLIIAGSDSGGGAGIQADIKTVTALGGYASTAITALTAQNTQGVHAILPIETNFITRQIEVVSEDIGADAVKTGMLFSSELIDAVTSSILNNLARAKWILDPVMVAKGGARLLQKDAESALINIAIPHCYIITPNIPEAEVISGMQIDSFAKMQAAGEKILALGPHAVLMKGGHLPGDDVSNLLITQSETIKFDHSKIATTSTHGTGCTLASAVATGIAQGLDVPSAVKIAGVYLKNAILHAPKIGKGHGPLNHGWNFQDVSKF